MNILALDTSGERCSVALWRSGRIDARESGAGLASGLVLGMIDELLGHHGLKIRQLDGVAFGEGPGSFTGLRIACGVTQGLAFGAGLPVVGIGTLLAMAESTGADRVVCCMDARMHEIYHAAYAQAGGTWRTVSAPALCPPGHAPGLPDGTWCGCGSGFGAYADVLAQRYDGRLAAVLPDVVPHAREIARLAVPLFEAGRGMDAAFAVPVYLRDKVALRTDER